MKTIVCVNTEIPTVVDSIDYLSGESLRDYDIAVFDPEFPYLRRIEFTGGGSCISIEASLSLTKAIAHWSSELRGALQAGKTIFILLNEYEKDLVAIGSTMKTRTERNYNTSAVDNYCVIPINLNVKNSKGRKFTVVDNNYRNLYDSIKEISQYRVIMGGTEAFPGAVTKTIFAAGDGATIGATVKFANWTGSMVLLPYFDFHVDRFVNQEDSWNDEAISASYGLVNQLVAIDKSLRGATERSPPPNWVTEMEIPNIVVALDESIFKIDAQVAILRQERDERVQSKTNLQQYSHLLYESGNALERAIEKTLRLLGYTVDNLRVGDLEIDHVVVGPSGKRMIGESEGKDHSAIDISKFRQLESNVGEDFQRDEIDEPAKGLLFGNGFRLTAPQERAEQFTQKCLTNAKRLGSALIRTADLYPVAIHLLHHPEDEQFKEACRLVIEQTTGDIVDFPIPQRSIDGVS